MIKSIKVTNHLGESLTLELAFPAKSGLAVLGVEGLGPPQGVINQTNLATTDGSVFNSARAASRNIVLYLKFLWKPTIEVTRQLTYKYFPIKKRIRLEIETDQKTTEVYGYVETNQIDIFNNSQGSQISIVCPSAYLQSLETTITTLSGVDPIFEFPFENASLTDPLLEFGDIQNDTATNLYYAGTVDTGVNMFIHAIGEVHNPTFFNETTRESMKIDTDILTTLTGSPIIAGDDIEISTIKGNKYVILTRAGVEINIISCVEVATSWFTVISGDNVFLYIADSGLTNLQLRIENKELYEGV